MSTQQLQHICVGEGVFVCVVVVVADSKLTAHVLTDGQVDSAFQLEYALEQK